MNSFAHAKNISSLPSTLSHLGLSIVTIVSRLIDLLKKAFWLSYTGVEILDAIVYDRFTEFMSISGVWQNGNEVVQHLTENLEGVSDELTTNSEFINKLLSVTKSDIGNTRKSY